MQMLLQFLLLFLLSQTNSQEFNSTIFAIQDSYVAENGNCGNSNCQSSNFGTSTNLFVRGNMNTGNFETFLTFPLNGLENFQSINNFTLQMFYNYSTYLNQQSICGRAAISLFYVAGDFDQSTITWANKPSWENKTFFNFYKTVDGVFEGDVTLFATTALSKGRNKLVIALKTFNSDTQFYSSEASVLQRPRLIINGYVGGVSQIAASQDAGVYSVRNFGGCSGNCASTNFGSESEIVTGFLNTADLLTNSTFQNRGMGLLQFNIPNRSSPIIRAEILLRWYGFRRLVSRAGDFFIRFYAINQIWTESTVNYGNLPPYNSQSIGNCVVNIGECTNPINNSTQCPNYLPCKPCILDITSIVNNNTNNNQLNILFMSTSNYSIELHVYTRESVFPPIIRIFSGGNFTIPQITTANSISTGLLSGIVTSTTTTGDLVEVPVIKKPKKSFPLTIILGSLAGIVLVVGSTIVAKKIMKVKSCQKKVFDEKF